MTSFKVAAHSRACGSSFCNAKANMPALYTQEVHQLCPMELRVWIRVGSNTQSPKAGSNPRRSNFSAKSFLSCPDKVS